MGQFLQEVSSRQASPVALAHRIGLFLNTDRERAVVTEAGDDAFFYASILKRYQYSHEVEFFIAHGRGNVLTTMQVVSNIGKGKHCYGIVDRDFNYEEDSLTMNGHCFVLDQYSFENLFGSREVLIDIGKYMFSLEVGGHAAAVWDGYVNNFLGSIESSLFEQHVLAYTAKKLKLKCYLNNFNIAAYVTIDADGSLLGAPDLATHFLAESQLQACDLGDSDVAVCRDVLSSLTWTKRFRGHYFWTLFVRLLNMFREQLDASAKRERWSRARTRAAISERHALESSVSFVKVPENLSTFLQQLAECPY